MNNEPLTAEERTEMRLVATLLPSLTFDFKRFYAEPDPDKRITISRVLATIDALESELLRIAGPVCPHDGKRAVEHELASGTSVEKFAGQTVRITRCAEMEAGRLCHCPPHPPAPEIEKWLRERSGR